MDLAEKRRIALALTELTTKGSAFLDDSIVTPEDECSNYFSRIKEEPVDFSFLKEEPNDFVDEKPDIPPCFIKPEEVILPTVTIMEEFRATYCIKQEKDLDGFEDQSATENNTIETVPSSFEVIKMETAGCEIPPQRFEVIMCSEQLNQLQTSKKRKPSDQERPCPAAKKAPRACTKTSIGDDAENVSETNAPAELNKTKCSICHKEFATSSSLSRHVRNIHYNAFSTCAKCGKKLRRLEEHMKKVHSPRVKCPKCKRPVSNLDKHTAVCQKVCTICCRVFSSQRYLTQHMNAKHSQ